MCPMEISSIEQGLFKTNQDREVGTSNITWGSPGQKDLFIL